MGSVFNNIFCMGRGRFFCIRYGWKDLFKKIFIWMEIVYRMEKGLYDALQVRFIKLHFTVAFLQDSQLPEDKVSAIRGGMGEMLLRMNCIRDRQCESCDFEPECIVQRTMYSKFEKTPKFVTTGGSIGYVLECEDDRRYFRRGETLDFYLILFGKTIVYLNQFVQAFQEMGIRSGIGKSHARFLISDIKNTEGQSVLMNNVLDMRKCIVHVLYDYLLFRTMWSDITRQGNRIVFRSPLTLKYQNEFLQEFRLNAIVNAVVRRIYMLDCFEGIESDIYEKYNYGGIIVPEFLQQENYSVRVCRYSTRKNEKMILKGIKGHALLPKLTEDIWQILIVGELIHIGKNTSFGFGRYVIQ